MRIAVLVGGSAGDNTGGCSMEHPLASCGDLLRVVEQLVFQEDII